MIHRRKDPTNRRNALDDLPDYQLDAALHALRQLRLAAGRYRLLACRPGSKMARGIRLLEDAGIVAAGVFAQADGNRLIGRLLHIELRRTQ